VSRKTWKAVELKRFEEESQEAKRIIAKLGREIDSIARELITAIEKAKKGTSS
jgi:hypothetical protein